MILCENMDDITKRRNRESLMRWLMTDDGLEIIHCALQEKFIREVKPEEIEKFLKIIKHREEF